MPFLSNVPALRLTLAYALNEPSALLPHRTIPTLLPLALPISSWLPAHPSTGKQPTIRALVLDKDNTICPPETTKLHPTYLNKLEKIRQSEEFAHSPHSILIVSNTAGSSDSPAHEEEAVYLEEELGFHVLRQHPERKKPFCGPDILKYFRDHGVTDDPLEVVILGDRLATDVLLAREMGAWSVWTRLGWRNPEMPGRDFRGFVGRMEGRVERVLRGGFGLRAPLPRGKETP